MLLYFISYFWTNSTGSGNGRCDISRSTPIVEIADVFEMEAAIKKGSHHNHDTKIVILNWQRFEDAVV